jgi:RNA polymerase sigma-70 factor (ECF subfamily)
MPPLYGSNVKTAKRLCLPPKPHYTAQEYAMLFQQGDERALEWAYHEFYAALALFANRWVNNRPLAEEIASEAFVKIWRMHYKLDSYGAIRAYLYKIVQRDCLRAIKQEQRRNKLPEAAKLATITNETAFDNLVRAETYRIIHSALKHLSPGSRKVLIMHYLEGKSTGEIASELKLAPTTVYTQKMRGLNALRKKLLRTLILLVFFF